MDARNPRSKLGMMKRRYFIVTMTVFLGLFLVAYLMIEILFMIFEAEPYTRLLVVFVLLVFDFVATDHIINQVLKDRWPREAPDILDVIKTPEPAYIPEGPVDAAADSAKPDKKSEIDKSSRPERRRLHRTQYQEISKELPADETAEKTERNDAPVSDTKKEQPDEPEPKKRFRFPGKKKQKEHAPSAEDAKQSAAAPEGRSWKQNLDDMDTVEFEDAVMSLEKRIRKTETKHAEVNADAAAARAMTNMENEPRRETSEPKRNGEERNTERRSNRNHRRTKKPQNPVSPTDASPKRSSWSGSLDDMDTVSVSRAIQNISPEETAEKRSRRKRRRRSRSSGNNARKESVSPVEKQKQ